MGKIIVNFTKERLKEIGIKPNLFYYSILDNSVERNYNKTIIVSVLKKDMSAIHIGEHHINTASYKGNIGSAVSVIGEVFNYKNDGYSLAKKNIKLFEI